MVGDHDEYPKLPGYHRVWGFAEGFMAGRRYRIADVGILSDGGALFAAIVAVVPGVG
jgi:hypothetical protein